MAKARARFTWSSITRIVCAGIQRSQSATSVPVNASVVARQPTAQVCGFWTLRPLDDHDADVVRRGREGPQVCRDGIVNLSGPVMFDFAKLPLEMVRKIAFVLFPMLH